MIWHDIINNSTSRHRSNYFNPLSEDKLVAILKRYRAKISATAYCHCSGTEETFEKLNNSCILTISRVDHLISKRMAKNKWLRKQYLALHQPDKLEIKFFQIFRRHGENIRTIIAKTKRKNE